ncbi:diguanylate cyclase [Dongia sedimenti]|uniref:diguanylate cyclase n=1 Tax=Dongia sedimenti TaxID=3064282 RepID=A0ABU0YNG7_9PROT|nr:GGDEF domain-containing protein [Rhodospirillaceae bacterium R-7]
MLKSVVGAAALCGLAALLLTTCNLLQIGPAELAMFDRRSAASLFMVALGVLMARSRAARLWGRLLTALGGFFGLAALLAPNEVSPAISAALVCYGAASLLFLAPRFGIGQAAAALAFLPSLGSLIGYLLGTEVLFGMPPASVLLATVLCGAALLGGTAHRGAIRVFLSNTISGRFARKQIVIASLVPIALAVFFAQLLPDGARPLALAETVASMIVIAWITIGATALVGRRLDIKRHRAEAELRSMARHDALTGLLNRRSMNSALPQHHAEARAEGLPITLMMCDLDHFKKLNDEYGHAVGDDVLRRTAQRVNAAVRDSDLVFRYGGEEIAVLLQCGPSDAVRIAEKIREAVKARGRRAGDEGFPPVTISIGAATSERGRTDLKELMAAADDRLYAAKDAGRDCVRHVTLP